MSLSFDLFWSFRSPYSYLATGRLVEIEREYDLVINVRPVYPIAVRMPDFFQKVNPLWPPYLMRDTFRIAEMLGIPYRWPNPDPIVQDFESKRVAESQPYIHRLTRLGIAAVEHGRGLSFLDEVSRIIWGGIDEWHLGDHLAQATARAGLELKTLDQEIEKEPARYESVIEANQQAHLAAGHWGVPTMVFEGEPFFGQDRLDVLLWRMKQRGLQPRAR